jgi:hypothetical protein
MAINPYITDNLLPTLRLLPLMPAVQALFTDDNLLTIMTFEMNSKIVPLIDNQTEEYFVNYYDIPFDASVNTYTIPPRATAAKLRAVSFVDPNNNEIRLPRLRPEDIMGNINSNGFAINPSLWGFYLKNNKVMLYLGSFNGPSTSYKFVRMRYIRQPNRLVLSTACGQVVSIAGDAITVNAVPSAFTTADVYDLIPNTPQTFDSLLDGGAIVSIIGSVITFAAGTVPATLQKGDWVCLAGQSPIPQIPYNPGFELLLQLSAAKCLEIHGDTSGFNLAMSQASDMKNYFISLLTPRVDGNVIKLTSPNSIYNND